MSIRVSFQRCYWRRHFSSSLRSTYPVPGAELCAVEARDPKAGAAVVEAAALDDGVPNENPLVTWRDNFRIQHPVRSDRTAPRSCRQEIKQGANNISNLLCGLCGIRSRRRTAHKTKRVYTYFRFSERQQIRSVSLAISEVDTFRQRRILPSLKMLQQLRCR